MGELSSFDTAGDSRMSGDGTRAGLMSDRDLSRPLEAVGDLGPAKEGRCSIAMAESCTFSVMMPIDA